MADEALYELKVLGGKDQGRVVPLEGESIILGHGMGGFAASRDEIRFEEPTVSRVHAVLNWNQKENVYHVSNRSPINPVAVDGTPAASGRALPGVRLQMGQLVVEVVAREGVVPAETERLVVPAMPPTTGGFLGDEDSLQKGPLPAWVIPQPAPTAAPARAESGRKGRKKKDEAAPKPVAAQPPAEPASGPVPPATAGPPRGRLEVLKGAAAGQSFPVVDQSTIGRSPDCTIALTDKQVSRLHCCIEFEGDAAFLLHLSSSSTTKVNRTVVKDRHHLRGGEEITLADHVVLRWVAESP